MQRLYTLLVFLLFALHGSAQCVPDTTTTPGYSPDSATGLPHAVVGQPYTAVIQVRVPATYQGNNIDSVVLNSVNGLPAGFSYSCTPAGCHILASANGCMQIIGPAFPLDSAGNVYPLVINLTAYVHIGPFSVPVPQTISFYSIIVDQPTGMPALSRARFDASQNYPNPFSDRTTIAFTMPVAGQVVLKVYNLLGSVVATRMLPAKAGMNFTSLQARDFSPGIYIASLSDGKTTLTRRIVVKGQ